MGDEEGRAEYYQFATYAHKLEGFVPLRIERLHDRLALGLLSRQRQPDVALSDLLDTPAPPRLRTESTMLSWTI